MHALSIRLGSSCKEIRRHAPSGRAKRKPPLNVEGLECTTQEPNDYEERPRRERLETCRQSPGSTECTRCTGMKAEGHSQQNLLPVEVAGKPEPRPQGPGHSHSCSYARRREEGTTPGMAGPEEVQWAGEPAKTL